MRIAVVLFNLGGPGSMAAVEPFLFSLFNDRYILRVPQPFRWLLAKFISKRRAPIAREIYTKLGGSSPILGQTYNQSSALKDALAGGEVHYETFVAMRHSAPRAFDVVQQVKRFRPNHIVLLPLYPQFSSTTTLSSIEEWKATARDYELTAPAYIVCCYPENAGWIEAQTELLKDTLNKLPPNIRYRVLFSAHGLPENIVKAGDPYPAHISRTVSAVVQSLNNPHIDWKISYQSRVGPMKWIGPSTEDEIKRAGKEGLALVVVPVAFVSEHSETIVELDMEYASLAAESGITNYLRVPTVGTHPKFISGLALLVRAATKRPGIAPENISALCNQSCRLCPASGRTK